MGRSYKYFAFSGLVGPKFYLNGDLCHTAWQVSKQSVHGNILGMNVHKYCVKTLISNLEQYMGTYSREAVIKGMVLFIFSQSVVMYDWVTFCYTSAPQQSPVFCQELHDITPLGEHHLKYMNCSVVLALFHKPG